MKKSRVLRYVLNFNVSREKPFRNKVYRRGMNELGIGIASQAVCLWLGTLCKESVQTHLGH